jgi:ABC-2 type transport system permease protein
MDKIVLIIKREYLTRVRKKSFLIMTILGPLLMASAVVLRIWLSMVPEETKKVVVVDVSHVFADKFQNAENIRFFTTKQNLEETRRNFYKEDFDILLYVPENILQSYTVQVFYKKQPGYGILEYIRNSVKNQIEEQKLLASGIDVSKIQAAKTTVSLVTSKIEESGRIEKKNTEVLIAVGFIGGFLIYIFIFLYGAQVMRGVIEEKTNRIVEVIISSVKPFQLMMGKIIGIALVGLTQFLLWVVLTAGITNAVLSVYMSKKYDTSMVAKTFSKQQLSGTTKDQLEIPDTFNEIQSTIDSIQFGTLIGCFLFYFLGGYLLYSALFAAVGSAVDSESDTQQFMLPLSTPLLLAFFVAQAVITNPDGSLAFWFSMIPFTSPVVMMVRIPFGVPVYQIILSMVLLILGFIGTTWLAGRVYRTGILMYGKKTSYKEIWKWLFYKS